MEGHVRLVDDAERTEEREQGVLGEEARGVQSEGSGQDYTDPAKLRTGVIEQATLEAVRALEAVRRSLDLLAVVDRDAAQRKTHPTLKAVSDLVEHLEEKT